jgi:4-diphosphocytidyl-2-C-methyl-D-erythritol kinase
MIVFPKAKINLGLRITRKRSDGFHDIETIFYPVGLTDALEFAVSDSSDNRDHISVTGINPGGLPEDNLVIKAVIKLREMKDLPFLKIHLHKVIPAGAGLGGGSSDGACFLKAVNRHFNLNIDDKTIKHTALELGSDCPFFIDGVPAFATGRGENLKPVAPVLNGFYFVLLNPGVGINTREAYLNCKPLIASTSLTDIISQPIENWKSLILNDFEDFAFSRHPVIKEIKTGLYDSGALFSLMSGSGSSVYGIFKEKTRIPDQLIKYLIWEGIL